MQGYSVTTEEKVYTADHMGRPAKTHRTAFGERLHAARLAAGLSQAHVADKLGITQQSFAGWERRETAIKPDQIGQLAEILGVSVEHVLGLDAEPKRGTGPAGKLRQVFERANQLPRDQQKHIVRSVEDTIFAYEVRRARATTAA
jgi:transcriptional regulator with XRE-family HTH domain